MSASAEAVTDPPTTIQVGVLDYYEPPNRKDLEAELSGLKTNFAEGKEEADRLAVAADCDVLLAGWQPVSAAVIEASPRLRMIQKMGVGVDKIDTEAAAARGVRVLRAAGINADAVAEMTILLILAVLRELPWATSQLRAGAWEKETLRARTTQLPDQRVGLIGLGAIGAEVAARLKAFKVETAFFDVAPAPASLADPPTPMALDELLAWSDIVSLHVPLTPQTRNLLDAERLAALKPGGVVINTARGGLIDEDALCDAIDSGHLRGAGLDVTAAEPVSPDSRLLKSDRIIVTPHQGGAVASNFANVARRARSNIQDFFAGKPLREGDVVC
jgi:phosphoglycerate dehydrogenase-like enzyme